MNIEVQTLTKISLASWKVTWLIISNLPLRLQDRGLCFACASLLPCNKNAKCIYWLVPELRWSNLALPFALAIHMLQHQQNWNSKQPWSHLSYPWLKQLFCTFVEKYSAMKSIDIGKYKYVSTLRTAYQFLVSIQKHVRRCQMIKRVIQFASEVLHNGMNNSGTCLIWKYKRSSNMTSMVLELLT